MSTAPIDRYLDELAGRLPVPSPRLIDEARAHLEAERDALIATGLDPETAEHRAVSAFGDSASIVAAVKDAGGPLFSPRALRLLPWIAALFVLPTLVFIAVNLIEQLAGNQGGIGVFGTALDRWETPLNLMITAGPVVALAVVVIAGVRVDVARRDRGVHATIQVKLGGWLLVVAVVSFVVAATVAAYILAENVFCIPGAWEIC